MQIVYNQSLMDNEIIKFLALKFISSCELIKLKILKPPLGTEKWLVLKELE